MTRRGRPPIRDVAAVVILGLAVAGLYVWAMYLILSV